MDRIIREFENRLIRRKSHFLVDKLKMRRHDTMPGTTSRNASGESVILAQNHRELKPRMTHGIILVRRNRLDNYQ